jgi:Fe-S-cluster-containing hydrogenase component 2
MLTFTDEQLDWIAERIPDAPISAKGGRPTADKRRTLRGIFWMQVFSIVEGQWPNLKARYLPLPCLHCEKPPCTGVCPVDAMILISAHDPHKPSQKIAKIEENLCLGCGLCVRACTQGALILQSRPARVITPWIAHIRIIMMTGDNEQSKEWYRDYLKKLEEKEKALLPKTVPEFKRGTTSTPRPRRASGLPSERDMFLRRVIEYGLLASSS